MIDASAPPSRSLNVEKRHANFTGLSNQPPNETLPVTIGRWLGNGVTEAPAMPSRRTIVEKSGRRDTARPSSVEWF